MSVIESLNQMEVAVVDSDNDLVLSLEQMSTTELGLEYWSRQLGQSMRPQE
jgi:hypothetical protein